jgi:V/A-type H+-transporting ATPase subunit E
MADKVVKKILKEAEKKTGEILEAARNEARRITASASKESLSIAEQGKQLSKEKALEEKERILATAKLDIRKAVLERKQSLMEEAFRNAILHLRRKKTEEYVALIEKLLLGAVDSGTEEVIVGEADREIINSQVIALVNRKLGDKGKLTLSPKAGSMTGGFVLRQGKIDKNFSFDGLIELAREGLETQVAKLLFQE